MPSSKGTFRVKYNGARVMVAAAFVDYYYRRPSCAKRQMVVDIEKLEPYPYGHFSAKSIEGKLVQG